MASEEHPHCAPFAAAAGALRRARVSARARPRLAVCLTGQLRLFMVSFPALARNLLVRASDHYLIDIFYVGPSDISFARGRAYLRQVPGLHSLTLYSPSLRWRDPSKTPSATRMREPPPLAELLWPEAAPKNGSHRRATVGVASLASAAALQRAGCGGAPSSRLRSRLVQALQARECLALIERAESSPAATRMSAQHGVGAVTSVSSSMPVDGRYAAVLRARADLLPTRPVDLPSAHRRGASSARASSAGRAVLSSLFDCPGAGSGVLAPHDFALYGERAAMGTVLGALDGLELSRLARAGCDFGAVAMAQLRRAPPTHGARCVVPRNRTPVASVRGSIVDRCFFVDQEHPPNDDAPQPRLADVFLGAAGVATECLGLREQRDGRRPGVGAACRARGGWDGDFREDASPWDDSRNGGGDTAPNRGSG